jgi:hypothetical protein
LTTDFGHRFSEGGQVSAGNWRWLVRGRTLKAGDPVSANGRGVPPLSPASPEHQLLGLREGERGDERDSHADRNVPEEAVAVAEVLPIVPGWNYLVRLYQRTEVLDLP